MRGRLAAGAVAGGLLLVSCDGGGPEDPPTGLTASPETSVSVSLSPPPTTSSPTPSGTPTSPGAPTTPNAPTTPALPTFPGFPTIPPLPTGVAGGSLSSGQAELAVSGGATADIALTLRAPAVYAPQPGGFAVLYADDAGNTFGVGGLTFRGTRRSSPSMVVSLFLPGQGFFASSQGECRVTVSRADATGIEGSISCDDLTGAAEPTAVSGTFEGSV